MVEPSELRRENGRLRGLIQYALDGPPGAMRDILQDALDGVTGADDYAEARRLREIPGEKEVHT